MLPGKREPRRKGNRFRRHEECTKSGERHIDILKRLQGAYKIGPHRVRPSCKQQHRPERSQNQVCRVNCQIWRLHYHCSWILTISDPTPASVNGLRSFFSLYPQVRNFSNKVAAADQPFETPLKNSTVW
ncbi:hypothetical protein T06_927 [Trichinella sp. T6]|nr:hypothetical protein T06_927 [Trichinella sp. T6]